MTSPIHVIVESMAAVDAVRRHIGAGNPVWFSTSPMVAESLRHQGQAFTWLDSLLPSGLPNALGEAAWRFAATMAEMLEPACARIGHPKLARLMTTPLQRLTATLLFKAEALARWRALSAGRRIVAGDDMMTLQNAGSLGIGFYDTVYAALSARMQPGCELVATSPVDTGALLREIDRPIMLDHLLSMSDISADLLISRLIRAVFGNRPVRLRRGGPVVAILRDNESIRGMLPNLLRHGCQLRHMQRQPAPSTGSVLPGLPDAKTIAAQLDRCVASTESIADLHVIADLIAEALHDASQYWKSALDQAEKTLPEIFPPSGRGILVSSTIGGVANLALAEKANERGVPVCVVEHGVSAGLSKYHTPVRPYSEAAPAQQYLVVSQCAEQFFRADQALTECDLRAIGLPRQTRTVPNRWLQRPLARLRIGARSGERVVMYVTRHVQNNLRFLPHTPEDREVHALQRTMADRVMPHIRGVPVIKLYGTRRYRDPDPMAGGFAAPAPVKTFKAGDFRYLRAGADIIILESPLSTLGWAMGAGKPVCYLAHPSLPLLPEAQAAMQDALFFIDMAQADWPDRLVASLNRADETILAEWMEKTAARRRFLERFVFGPENPGENGAAAVIAAARCGVAGRHVDKQGLAAE